MTWATAGKANSFRTKRKMRTRYPGSDWGPSSFERTVEHKLLEVNADKKRGEKRKGSFDCSSTESHSKKKKLEEENFYAGVLLLNYLKKGGDGGGAGSVRRGRPVN